jgi:polyisoprenyl-phosphate glycosyltransferase
MKKIRILLPIYNEADSINEFHSALKKKLDEIDNHLFDILFIVDKSTDNTENLINVICDNNSNCEALLMSSRFGHQECIYAGLEYSKKYDAVIMMDCDFQHPINLINDIIEKYNSGYEIVNTKRIENNQRSLIKKFGTEYFYKLIKKLALPNIEENSADFRLISNKIVNIILDNYKENKILIRGIISLIGFNSCYLEYKENERKFGKTKYGLLKMISFAINGIVSFTSLPLFIIFLIGLILSLFSLTILLFFILSYFMQGDVPAGWTSVATLQLIFGSINLLFLGFLGIYVGKIFDEIKKRPKYLIEKIIKNKDE